MDLSNFNKALDLYLGPFFPDEHRDKIVKALHKDLKIANSLSDDTALILSTYNNIFNKKNRIISTALLKKYNNILSTFSLEEITLAMVNAKNDEWHKSVGWKHLTLMYFSRSDQIDKWLNTVADKPSSFNLPRFNIKE
jgi:hypothetical protein